MNDLVQRGPTMEQMFLQAQVEFTKIADKHKLVVWAEECNFARQAVDRNTKLAECTVSTLRDAIVNVAAVGLTLNPAYGYAYLIPEAQKRGDNWVQEARLQVSFKGLIAKATEEGGPMAWVVADVVYENDTFVFNGKWALPDHKMDNPFGDRGKPIGVYCTGKTHADDVITELAPWSEVMKAKAAAKTKNVWDKWQDEMAKKFIIKRASKQWPRHSHTDGLQTAVAALNEIEGSESEIDQLDVTAAAIIKGIADDDYEAVHEAWAELTDEEKQQIWTAKTKGGWFTQDEKKAIRNANERSAEDRNALPDSIVNLLQSSVDDIESLADVEQVLSEITKAFEDGEIERGQRNDLTDKAEIRRDEITGEAA